MASRLIQTGNTDIEWTPRDDIKPINPEEEYNTPGDGDIIHLHSGVLTPRHDGERPWAVCVESYEMGVLISPPLEPGEERPPRQPTPFQEFWVLAPTAGQALGLAATYAEEHGLDPTNLWFIP